LSQAYDTLNAVISDPNNITAGFDLPTELANGVKATWASSEPGVVSIGTPSNGTVVVTVNRPAKGDGDATVTLTATLSVVSPVTEEEVTYDQQWTVELKVKEKEVEDIVIETVSDILALDNEAYDGTYQVTIEDMTIFANGGSGVVFAYDGTGIIQIYGAPDNIEVGKVYTIAGTIEWYFGIWEITEATATEQAGATAQMPTKETVSSVNTQLDALITSGEHQYATVADGNFEPVYASVTGVVYKVPGDTSNYNTFIVDTTYDTTQDWVAGSEAAPARGLMLYYGTNNFGDVRLYEGITVTLDVVIYTYRSNNKAFAIYYVGGEDGIDATLTDEQALTIDSNALTLPEGATTDGTLTLPATGANGSSIVWTFTDTDNADNSLINLTTGAYTVPTGRQASVGLTATITKGSLDAVVKDFVFKLGEYPLSTTDDVKAGSNDSTFKIQGVVLGYIANNTIAIQDAEGGIAIFNYDGVDDLEALIGHNVELVGVRDAYNGLVQLTDYTVEDLGEATLPTAFDLQTILDWNAETLLPYQSTLVDLANLKITAWTDANYGNIEMTLLDETTGNTINFKWDSRVDIPNRTFLEATKEGDYVTFSGAALGWSSNKPLLTLTDGNQISAGTAPTLTDANYVLLDAKEIDITTTFIEAGTITFPTTGSNGSTIAWTFTDSEDVDNALVDLTTGAVTLPTEFGTAEVGVTATVTKGTESTTKTFVIEITYVEPTPDLFISEYIEGGSNNKAIELYNPTDAAIDLSNYKLVLFSNGSETYSNNIVLTGTLQPGEVYVVYNADSVADISNVGDVTSTITYFNGDDAIALIKLDGTDETIIDVFGIIGEDPGTYWEVGADNTLNHTLVRNANVTYPTAIWDPSQWTAYDQDTFTYLGSHTSDLPAE
jgi:hypothetical protein